jgi:hypothetical protein
MRCGWELAYIQTDSHNWDDVYPAEARDGRYDTCAIFGSHLCWGVQMHCDVAKGGCRSRIRF